jgi:phenylacetate-CoA ligase
MNLALARWCNLLRLIRRPRSIADIAEFQSQRLRALVGHAAAEVPCYRGLFERAGLRAEDVRGTADLRRIPVLTKADLRMLPESERVARGVVPEHLVTHFTGGSTGQPVRIRRTRSEELLLGLLRMRVENVIGVRPRDVGALLTEASLGSRRMLPGRIVAAAGFFRYHAIPADAPREEMAAEFVRLAPDVLQGYPNVVRGLAAAVESLGASFKPPRMVITGSETLLPEAREQIEEVFRAPLYDHYGAHEFNLLTWQCPHDSSYFHVCDEGVILEVLRDGEPVAEGEQGDVVATALHSHAMPFIRYSTGDLAVRGPTPCPCGWQSGTLRSLDGRSSDYFLLPEGRWLHPVCIVGPMLAGTFGWIDRFQLVQEREDQVTMKIKTLRPPPGGAVGRIERQARDVLGSGVQFRVELVDTLELEQGRKHRFFISRSAPQDHRSPVSRS